MSELTLKPVLIIDCQTTGMHPSKGFLLQIAWSLFDFNDNEPVVIKKTLKVPENEIPRKIVKLLNLTTDDLEQAQAPQSVFLELQQTIHKLGPEPIVIAHYAQFERSFLKKFYLEQTQNEELNFSLHCSQKIAKKLLPALPSHNLCALAGHFKISDNKKYDAASHVLMTYALYRQLIMLLAQQQIHSFTQVFQWLENKSTPATRLSYQYNIERIARLNIPQKPGVYHMVNQAGHILYVGKATCLKSRVNSYFRGIKNRRRFTLEMLTQVWSINTFECETPLEAALLECDEIKKWDPPYNIQLKNDRKEVIFYDKAYNQYAEKPDSIYCKGPHKPYDALAQFIVLISAIKNNEPIPHEEYSPLLYEDAWHLFCEKYALDAGLLQENNWRRHFTIGYQLLIDFEASHGQYRFETWWRQEKKEIALQELSDTQHLAQRIARGFIRAAECLRKSRQLRHLFNAKLTIKKTQKVLELINGQLNSPTNKNSLDKPAMSFSLAQYDKLTILLRAKKLRVLV